MQEENRRARRVHFQHPIEARLSDIPVSLIDLSASGACIQHTLHIPGGIHKEFQLEFEYEGQRFALPCQVSRTRVDHLRSSADRIVYTSGLRFTGVSDQIADALLALVGGLTATEPDLAAPIPPQPVRIVAP